MNDSLAATKASVAAAMADMLLQFEATPAGTQFVFHMGPESLIAGRPDPDMLTRREAARDAARLGLIHLQAPRGRRGVQYVATRLPDKATVHPTPVVTTRTPPAPTGAVGLLGTRIKKCRQLLATMPAAAPEPPPPPPPARQTHRGGAVRPAHCRRNCRI